MLRKSLSILGYFVAGVVGGTCDFKALPEVSYVWDPACRPGVLGCFADRSNLECRYCGQEPYLPCTVGAVIVESTNDVHESGDVVVKPSTDTTIDTTTQTCTFAAPPKTPWMWDPTCKDGDVGCNADAIHVQCRFCGEGSFVPCPDSVIRAEHCTFENHPTTNFMWDTTCENGAVGCFADGVHMECRLCGEEPYPSCPTCDFELEPSVPYVWDSKCEPLTYTKGCFADAKHFQCRFCDGEGFDPCSTSTSTSTTTVSTTATAEPSSTYAHEVHVPSTTSLRGGDVLTSGTSSHAWWTLVSFVMGATCLIV